MAKNPISHKNGGEKIKMYQYEMFELSLTGEPPQGSQALFTFQTVFQLDGEERP